MFFHRRNGLSINNDTVEQDTAQHLPDILKILREKTGHDFTGYKPGTTGRRIARRLQVHRLNSVADYVARLEHDPAEAGVLCNALLISVTEFFRDPESFALLSATVLPELLSSKSAQAGVRVWVPGCATGEEAYSIAILLVEAMEKHRIVTSVQVLSTDLDGKAIAAARKARYAASALKQVSPERLKRFFIRQGDDYQVGKQIREMCVFSLHNLVRDPPFSALDLISCRNLLIYMDAGLQIQALQLFHYALSPGGYLFLGSSEGLGASVDLFQPLNEEHRLYQRKEGASRSSVVFPLTVADHAIVHVPEPVRRPVQIKPREVGSIITRMVMEYAPPCVVINEQAEIVYSSGETSAYLQQPTGLPTLNIFDHARNGLRAGLRRAIAQALETHQPVLDKGVALRTAGGMQYVDLIVRQLPGVGNSNRLAIFFQPARHNEVAHAGSHAGDEAAVEQLESELRIAREELQSTTEALERATEESKSFHQELLSMNEEMQAANEELQSAKEEMQSVNQELQSSTEEMQSVNHEMSVVNGELIRKVALLDLANADLQNLMRSTEIATLFLDRDLLVRRFTPTATLIFRLLESDIGRPISDFAPRFAAGLGGSDVVTDMKLVLETLIAQERQIYLPETHSWFLMRLLPSRTVDDAIDGVVATFVDITVLKQAEDLLRQSEERARQLTDTLPAIAWTARPDGATDFLNDRIRQYQGFHQQEDGTWEWRNALHPEDAEATLEGWRAAVKAGQPYKAEHRLRMKSGEWRWHFGQAVPICDEQGRIIRWSGTVTDIHDLRTAQTMRLGSDTARAIAERAGEAKDEFLAVLSHELRTPLAPVTLALSMLQNNPDLDADTHESLAMIRRNVELEARLIDDLLDVTRITQGKLELDRCPVDLSTILRQAVEVCMPDIEARKLEFGVDYPQEVIFVDADAVRLQQAFWNLLRNAVKFTPLGGCVGIRVSVEANETIVLEFNDSGAGISPEVLPQLFNAFQQGGRQTTRRFGGLGLGLSICRTLVTLHGGTVTAHSEGRGKGATFVVRLPRLNALEQTASDVVAPAKAVASALQRKLRILLVEDHGDTARIMRKLLTARGHSVELAADVATALRLAGEGELDGGGPQHFDLLISDLGLPDGSGLDLMRLLIKRKVKLPGIALSGYGQESDMQQSREAGFLHHLVKPVAIPQLEEAIARLTQQTQEESPCN